MERPTSVAAVFDFDKTLTVRHLYHLMLGQGRDESRLFESSDEESRYPGLTRGNLIRHERYMRDKVFGGSERIEQLRTLFRSLRAEGVTLYIASNNFVDNIEAALAMFGLLGFFRAINAMGRDLIPLVKDLDSGVTTEHAGRKEHFVMGHVRRLHRCVVFVDDEIKLSYWTYMDTHVKMIDVAKRRGERAGMNADDMEAVRDAVRECEEEAVTDGLAKRLPPCFHCLESEGIFYSTELDAVFCDPSHWRLYEQGLHG